MQESEIEKTLTFEVRKRGGLALKFISPGMSGVPDRLIIMKGGKLAFIELKAPGKKLRPLQIKRKKQLEELGFLVYCIDKKMQIGDVLDEICAT
ncbi:VRR-NUC domain-containing protein [Clostridium sp.]|uniref:VRR-NUC domain-containing protein n=1 Tax=Clostridium sp. TaxID=1506 RepID=UPI0034644D76